MCRRRFEVNWTFEGLGRCVRVKFWFATCENRSLSSNLSSFHAFSPGLLALDAKPNYACFVEGLKFIGGSKGSLGVFKWNFGLQRLFECKKRSTSSNLSSALAFSPGLLA
jgi:hypothetical protein